MIHEKLRQLKPTFASMKKEVRNGVDASLFKKVAVKSGNTPHYNLAALLLFDMELLEITSVKQTPSANVQADVRLAILLAAL